MKPKRYELVLLDADGTLFDYDRTEARALELSFAGAGIEYRKEDHLPRYREVNDRIWKEFENGLISASDLRTERFRRFFELVGIETDCAAFGRAYVANLAESGFLFPEAEPLLERLAPRFKLGMVTNGLKEVQRKRFAMTPVERYLSCIVVSDEVGVQKPGPGIFEHALEAAGHSDKSTVIMVGDSLSSDIRGGEAFGIDTCWFNPSGKPNDSAAKPTYEIRSLSELPAVLGL